MVYDRDVAKKTLSPAGFSGLGSSNSLPRALFSCEISARFKFNFSQFIKLVNSRPLGA